MVLMEGHLERLRRAEINGIKYWFKPGMHVLEIGGGNGYQAGIIASWGCKVVSIDINDRPKPQKEYFHVQDYDGRNIPFPDANFDLVFSSSVLEHIQPLSPILTEIKRVLKPDGLALCIVPSPIWRFWTSIASYKFSIAHYTHLLKEFLFEESHPIDGEADSHSMRDGAVRNDISYVIKRAIFGAPHGAYSSALSELYYFRKRRWFQVFQSNGFDIIEVFGNNLFYTGYGLFPALSLETREHLSSFMGSSCSTFIMRTRTFPEE